MTLPIDKLVDDMYKELSENHWDSVFNMPREVFDKAVGEIAHLALEKAYMLGMDMCSQHIISEANKHLMSPSSQ